MLPSATPASAESAYQRLAAARRSASRLDTGSVPELIADASVNPPLRLTSEEEWEISVPEDAEPCQLLIDPVLEYLVAVRKPLESDEDRAAFDDACRRVPVLPTAVEWDNETARAVRRANLDGTVFMPPENDIAGGALPDIQFLASELDHGSDPNRAKPLREAALPAEFGSDVRTIWNVKEYQFTQVFDAAISPNSPGRTPPTQTRRRCRSVMLRRWPMPVSSTFD
ncbi:hypothetical protein JMJ58_21420 (plasmid) [Haloterrigena salifodinae]|uniref:Uncharacterized protein n=1 Tax=Haloterrigena salifodinae TaxID=2675099 RepID=A0A8T8E6J3_9EURY|nr:hypothetical protein [Haloterrigena salifodinae]QRV17484.1 hypothetical protein JMJ58_21420 [Haloterrigena salifodinae]